MARRDEILANFQTASGIENVNFAIDILESTGWSFEDAVNLMVSQGNGPQPNPFHGARRVNIIEFAVHYNGTIKNIRATDDERIWDLKQRIETETKVKIKDQVLEGLHPLRGPLHYINNEQKISELFLQTINPIYLKNADNPSLQRYPLTSDERNARHCDFKLLITARKSDSHADEQYTIHFRPDQTVHRVKVDISDVTDIPVSRQKWEGWPENVYDNLTLERSGIPREHRLYVSSTAK